MGERGDPTGRNRDAELDGAAERMKTARLQAVEISREMIRDELRALDRRFPRHRFVYAQGLGVFCVGVHPPVFGSPFWLPSSRSGLSKYEKTPARRRVLGDLSTRLLRIFDLAKRMRGEFDADIGDVDT